MWAAMVFVLKYQKWCWINNIWWKGQKKVGKIWTGTRGALMEGWIWMEGDLSWWPNQVETLMPCDEEGEMTEDYHFTIMHTVDTEEW